MKQDLNNDNLFNFPANLKNLNSEKDEETAYETTAENDELIDNYKSNKDSTNNERIINDPDEDTFSHKYIIMFHSDGKKI